MNIAIVLIQYFVNIDMQSDLPDQTPGPVQSPTLLSEFCIRAKVRGFPWTGVHGAIF